MRPREVGGGFLVATPNLTFTVTPPGGSPIDYTANLAWSGAIGSPSITQHFGRQGDTATFCLVDDYADAGTPHFHVSELSQVKLVDNLAGVTLFAGVCMNPVQVVAGPTRNEWTLQCTDYTVYADNALVHGTFIGLTVDQIVVALTTQAACGITAAPVASGGFVQRGPVLPSFVLNYTTLSAAWRKLATLAGSVTPYGWYVDENRALHFLDATSATTSGVTFTTAPTTSGSLTEGHIGLDSNSYERDAASIRNRILVQGATQTIHYGAVSKPPTDVWIGNGTQNAWPLRYTVTGSPVLKLNGVTTALTVVAAGSSSTATWQVIQNSTGAWFLATPSTPPAPGELIQVWYDYQVPVVAEANDGASQAAYPGPNSGLFEEYINDTSLTTVPMALARAMRERTEYAFPAERATFTSSEDWLGWVRAGETCRIHNQFVWDAQHAQWGVDDTFIVISNSVSFGNGGYRQCQITAIRI